MCSRKQQLHEQRKNTKALFQKSVLITSYNMQCNNTSKMCSRKPQLHEQRKNTKILFKTKKCAHTLVLIISVRTQYTAFKTCLQQNVFK